MPVFPNHSPARASRLAAAVAAALALLAGCSDGPSQPARKAQVVKLLPDTPPPPPPPPPPQKPEEAPKAEAAPKPTEAPKPEPEPEQQALKSDEVAGLGPGNGLTAGAVSRDYTNEPLSSAPVIGGAPAAVDDGTARLAANLFASQATRALNDHLARDREIKRLDYAVRVDLWLLPSGRVDRAELVGSSGDAQTDAALREALGRFPGTGQPTPERLPQPMRVLVTNRMLG